MSNAYKEPEKFFFDFRPLLMDPQFLNWVTDVFWDRFEHYRRVQIVTLELGALTLLGAILLKAKARGVDANGLVVRKSRK